MEVIHALTYFYWGYDGNHFINLLHMVTFAIYFVCLCVDPYIFPISTDLHDHKMSTHTKNEKKDHKMSCSPDT